MQQIQAQFGQMGLAGQALFDQILGVIRGALAVAIQDVFLAGTVMMGLAAVACIFLREIPLRRSVRGGMTPAASGASGAAPADAPSMSSGIAPHLVQDSPEED